MKKPVLLVLGLVLATMAALLLGGCVTRRTYVLEAPAEVRIRQTVAIAHKEDTVEAEAASAATFEHALIEQVSERRVLASVETADVIVHYRFVHFDQGSTAVRLVSGAAGLFGSPFYGLGDGAVGVEATFTDRSGAVLGRIVADGPVAGFFGSTSGGLESAASSVAEFLDRNFPSEGAEPLATSGG